MTSFQYYYNYRAWQSKTESKPTVSVFPRPDTRHFENWRSITALTGAWQSSKLSHWPTRLTARRRKNNEPRQNDHLLRGLSSYALGRLQARHVDSLMPRGFASENVAVTKVLMTNHIIWDKRSFVSLRIFRRFYSPLPEGRDIKRQDSGFGPAQDRIALREKELATTIGRWTTSRAAHLGAAIAWNGGTLSAKQDIAKSTRKCNSTNFTRRTTMTEQRIIVHDPDDRSCSSNRAV